MKKLKIIFRDGSEIVYTLKNKVDHIPYLNRHSRHLMKSAVLQQYPAKENKPISLI